MSEPPAAPIHLGHYQITSPLGVGGMGEVYLATDTRLSRNVAIKVLAASTTTEQEGQMRMLREARLIATIEHPNVCTIYEIGEENDRPYIVMQYIQGETLGERMRRGRLSLAEAIDFGRQVTSALAEAHKHGIVHRDIKPGNIMISGSGVVKVLDFGLAKSFLRSADDATELVISRADTVSGTTPYMSPEQLLGETLDGRSDIFSFGVVLYEIASGKRPFDRRTAAATINAILSEDPERLPASDLAALEPLILGALAKRVDRRFPNASAMHEALIALGEGRSSPVRRVTSTTLGHCYGVSGQHELARELLHELEQSARERYVSPYNIMLVHLGLGETDLALDLLQRALEDRTGWLWHTPVEPRFDGIRDQPRVRELLARYGLKGA